MLKYYIFQVSFFKLIYAKNLKGFKVRITTSKEVEIERFSDFRFLRP